MAKVKKLGARVVVASGLMLVISKESVARHTHADNWLKPAFGTYSRSSQELKQPEILKPKLLEF